MRDKKDLQSVRRYMEEIEAYMPLSANEESELGRQIRKGDGQALEKLVKANLRFVVVVANKYQGLGLPLPDLISEGNLGLIKAAQRFDESRGFKFISYAVWWIRQAIVQALGDHGRVVRLPVNRLNARRKIEDATEALKQILEREPSIEEIAQNAQITTSEALNALMHSAHDVSLDALCGDDESTSLLDMLKSDQQASPDASLLEESLQDEIGQLISILAPREADIIRMYFGLDGNNPQTLEQLGERYQLTRERVRQIKERALKLLRRRACLKRWRKTRYPSRDNKDARFFTSN